jgi:hypothetical protein
VKSSFTIIGASRRREGSSWAASFSYGEKDYYLGGSPLWQLLRVVCRFTKRPLDGAALLGGYCWAAARRIRRPVSRELMRFHRREQMKKLRSIFRTLLKLKKVDNFRAEPHSVAAPDLRPSESVQYGSDR